MIGNKWFHEPNDSRESWGFLTINQKNNSREEPILNWKIGYGNPKKLTRMESSEESDEKERIRNLIEEIKFCMKNDVLLITLASNVIPKLRSRIFLQGIEKVRMRDLRQISIEDVFKDYFEGFDNLRDIRRLLESESSEDISEPESLWTVFKSIGPMLPKSCFRQTRK